MTLIEIMIVMAIIGLIMAAAIPFGMNMLERARIDSTKQQLKGIQQAINLFNIHTQTYPKTLKDLITKPSDPEVAADWGPQYLKKEPKDSWGNRIQYKLTPEAENEYELYSYGPKGKKSKGDRIDVWKLK